MCGTVQVFSLPSTVHCTVVSCVLTLIFFFQYPLDVHIGTEISPVGLRQLPDIKVHLDIADVRPGREKQVCEVAAALQPPQP